MLPLGASAHVTAKTWDPAGVGGGGGLRRAAERQSAAGEPDLLTAQLENPETV